MLKRHIPLFALALLLMPLVAQAQDTLTVTRTAEYNIGVRCPLGLTLDAAGEQAWILMDGCYDGGYALEAFQLADGTPITEPDQYVEPLEPLAKQWIYPDTRPFGFTPDGAVDIIYNDPDTYSAKNLRFTLDGSDAPASDYTLLTNEKIIELIPGFSGYFENTTYNTDHTLAFVPDTASVYVIDLKTETILFSIDGEEIAYLIRPYFSTDGQYLYTSSLINPDDMADYRSTLAVYNLPDGEPVKSYEVPTYFNVISPDNRYAIGVYSEETLMVTDLETGTSSEPIIYSEPPQPLKTCYNSGLPAPTGLDMQTSGKLYVRDIMWLPDSSGFLTVNTNQGQGLGGGRTCIYEYSRLRVYTVGQ
ncbi:MAG: hypothetical protein LCI00_14115 [Chloroflexi bacterium]|nr:hypothetical protein [Chloroflexota bacterium]MCC6892199.1 hypothetical protein [Anaerolineae bacterium]